MKINLAPKKESDYQGMLEVSKHIVDPERDVFAVRCAPLGTYLPEINGVIADKNDFILCERRTNFTPDDYVVIENRMTHELRKVERNTEGEIVLTAPNLMPIFLTDTDNLTIVGVCIKVMKRP